MDQGPVDRQSPYLVNEDPRSSRSGQWDRPRPALIVVLAAALAFGGCTSTPAASNPSRAAESPSAGLEAPSAPASSRPSTLTTASPSPAPAWTTVAWTETDPAPFSGLGNQYVFGGTVWSGGEVLVGEEAPEPTGAVAGVIWTSRDGSVWQRLPNTDGIFSAAEINAVAAFGSTLVAVGESRPEDQSQASNLPVGLAWISNDGIHWRRVPDPSETLGRVWLHGIVAGTDGFIIDGHDLGGPQVVLFSNDGLDWQPVSLPGSAADATSVDAIVATPDGYAAVGSGVVKSPPGVLSQSPGPAAAWWSTDGQTWHASDVGSGGFALESVAVWPGSLRATGSSACGGCIAPPIQWQSTDEGRSWQQLPASGAPSYTETSSLLVDGRVVELQDQPTVARWSADGQQWHSLQMSGPALPDRSQLELTSGQTVLVVAPYYLLPLPTGQPNDQVDMRVYLGVLH